MMGGLAFPLGKCFFLGLATIIVEIFADFNLRILKCGSLECGYSIFR